MSVSATALRKLAALGLSGDQMAGVLDLLASVSEDEDKRKEAARERTRRSREKAGRNVTVTQPKRDEMRDGSHGGMTRVEDKTSNLDIEPQKEEQKEGNALSREFADFWTAYPHKVGKPKAKVAFIAARKRASFEALMAGLHRYIAAKPADRAWLNPATFFTQDRWDDQPANVVPMARGSPNQMQDFISSVITRLDDADAITSAQIERYPTAPRRLSGNVSG